MSASFAIAIAVFGIVIKIITGTKQADKSGKKAEGLNYSLYNVKQPSARKIFCNMDIMWMAFFK